MKSVITRHCQISLQQRNVLVYLKPLRNHNKALQQKPFNQSEITTEWKLVHGECGKKKHDLLRWH